MDGARVFSLTVVLAVGSCPPAVLAQAPTKVLPTPQAPGKSLPATQPASRMVRSFSARGITSVVLRAAVAEEAEVKTIPGSQVVTVSGLPVGGAAGYHSPDPNWRETPAAQWGMNFEAKAFGPTLVVSTKKEILYIHHDYRLGSLEILVPPGVKVVKENRERTGEGPADLSPPTGK